MRCSRVGSNVTLEIRNMFWEMYFYTVGYLVRHELFFLPPTPISVHFSGNSAFLAKRHGAATERFVIKLFLFPELHFFPRFLKLYFPVSVSGTQHI